jgi:hypothetical protein
MQLLHQCSLCVCSQSHQHFVGRCSTFVAISLREVCFFVHDFSYVCRACYNWNLHNCCTMMPGRYLLCITQIFKKTWQFLCCVKSLGVSFTEITPMLSSALQCPCSHKAQPLRLYTTHKHRENWTAVALGLNLGPCFLEGLPELGSLLIAERQNESNFA